MSRHMTMEELTRFVWLEQVTPEAIALAVQVNSHLMTCQSCTQRMEQLQKLHEDTQRLRHHRAQLDRVNRKLKEINETLLPQYRS